MIIYDIRNKEEFDTAIEAANHTLLNNDLIIYPTDTIYGIGSDIFEESTLEKISLAKKRRDEKPFIVLVNSLEMLEEIAELNRISEQLANKYWPGPLTIILKSKIKLSKYILGTENKVAVRIPKSDFCLELLKKYNKPITSTSANISTELQGDFDKIKNDFKDKITTFIYFGEMKNALPSTIVDISSGELKIIRKGVLKL